MNKSERRAYLAEQKTKADEILEEFFAHLKVADDESEDVNTRTFAKRIADMKMFQMQSWMLAVYTRVIGATPQKEASTSHE